MDRRYQLIVLLVERKLTADLVERRTLRIPDHMSRRGEAIARMFRNTAFLSACSAPTW